jgi:hypothetical protein
MGDVSVECNLREDVSNFFFDAFTVTGIDGIQQFV